MDTRVEVARPPTPEMDLPEESFEPESDLFNENDTGGEIITSFQTIEREQPSFSFVDHETE